MRGSTATRDSSSDNHICRDEEWGLCRVREEEYPQGHAESWRQADQYSVVLREDFGVE